jgi:hypothetical protein
MASPPVREGGGCAAAGGRPGLERSSLQLRDSAGLALKGHTGFAFTPAHPGAGHQRGWFVEGIVQRMKGWRQDYIYFYWLKLSICAEKHASRLPIFKVTKD